MRYHHAEGVKRDKKPFLPGFLLVLAAIMFGAGVYILILVFAPTIPLVDNQPIDRVAKLVESSKPGDNGNRLYIPQINVDVAIVTGNDVSVLDKGAWHRKPENGDPEKGGNFVLSAHRFVMGFTPQQTRAKSPFYNIDKLEEGNEFYIDSNDKRYAYKITRKYEVERTALEIEAPSDQAKLTLYSCDLRGEQAGRLVIEAAPVGEVAGVKIQ
ncbi:MAG: sortase [Candidatus Saccharimonadales bacterium]